MDKYIEELENGITNYFLGSVASFSKSHPEILKEKIVREWAKEYGPLYNTPLYEKIFVKELLEPEYGLTLNDLLESLTRNRISFMDYITRVLESHDVPQRITEEMNFMEGLIFNKDEDGDEEDDGENQEKADEIKRNIIKGSLGEENLDIDDESGDELDKLFVKISSLINTDEE